MKEAQISYKRKNRQMVGKHAYGGILPEDEWKKNFERNISRPC